MARYDRYTPRYRTTRQDPRDNCDAPHHRDRHEPCDSHEHRGRGHCGRGYRGHWNDRGGFNSPGGPRGQRGGHQSRVNRIPLSERITPRDRSRSPWRDKTTDRDRSWVSSAVVVPTGTPPPDSMQVDTTLDEDEHKPPLRGRSHSRHRHHRNGPASAITSDLYYAPSVTTSSFGVEDNRPSSFPKPSDSHRHIITPPEQNATPPAESETPEGDNTLKHGKMSEENRPSEESKTLPKNFTQPLTCFYWKTQGTCKKSNDECIYAHHDTGFYADAPVSNGVDGAVAGTAAKTHMSVVAVQADALGHREQLLTLREKALLQHEAHVAQREEAVTAATDKLEEGFKSFSKAKEAAHAALINTFPRADSARGIVHAMEFAVDSFAAIVSDAKRMVADVRSPPMAPLPVKPAMAKVDVLGSQGSLGLPAKPPASANTADTGEIKGVFGKKFSRRK